MAVVETRPVLRPASLAASNTDPTGRPSGLMAIHPLFVLCPVARAVPPAAESVIKRLAEWVRTRPQT
jgi:hypothetical protein